MSIVGIFSAVAGMLARHFFVGAGPIVDSRVYLQQARWIAAGDIVGHPALMDFQRPFFSAANDRGEVILKYLPNYASILALFDALNLGEMGAVGFSSALSATGIVVVARRLGLKGAGRAAAAVATITSPLWLIQSGSLVSYAVTLGCVLWAAELTAVALGSDDGRAGAGAATLLVFAAGMRPFDVATWGAAMCAVCGIAALAESGPGPRPRHAIRWAAVAGACAALLTAGMCWRLTGAPWRLPFTVVGPDDRLGFGWRSDLETSEPHYYGVSEAWAAVRRSVHDFAVFAPLPAAGLSSVLFPSLARNVGRRAFVLIGPLVPALYTLFWGSWNASVRLRVTSLVGPFYYLPCVACGAIGLGTIVDFLGGLRSRPTVVRVTLRGGLIVCSYCIIVLSLVAWSLSNGSKVRADLADSKAYSERLEVVARHLEAEPKALIVQPGKDLLFWIPTYNSARGDSHPVSVLRRDRSFDELAAGAPGGRLRMAREVFILDREEQPDHFDAFGFARAWRSVDIRRTSGSSLTVRRSHGAAGQALAVAMIEGRWQSAPDGTAVFSIDRTSRLVDGGIELPELPSNGDEHPELCGGTFDPTTRAANVECFEASTLDPSVWWSCSCGYTLLAGPSGERWMPTDLPSDHRVTIGPPR